MRHPSCTAGRGYLRLRPPEHDVIATNRNIERICDATLSHIDHRCSQRRGCSLPGRGYSRSFRKAIDMHAQVTPKTVVFCTAFPQRESRSLSGSPSAPGAGKTAKAQSNLQQRLCGRTSAESAKKISPNAHPDTRQAAMDHLAFERSATRRAVSDPRLQPDPKRDGLSLLTRWSCSLPMTHLFS